MVQYDHQIENKNKKTSSSTEDMRLEAFFQVAQYRVEHDDKQVAMHDLIAKINEYLSDSGATAYTWKYMKK